MVRAHARFCAGVGDEYVERGWLVGVLREQERKAIKGILFVVLATTEARFYSSIIVNLLNCNSQANTVRRSISRFSISAHLHILPALLIALGLCLRASRLNSVWTLKQASTVQSCSNPFLNSISGLSPTFASQTACNEHGRTTCSSRRLALLNRSLRPSPLSGPRRWRSKMA